MFSGATITNTSLSQLHSHLFQKQNVRMSNVQTSSLTGGRKGVPKQKLPYGKGLGLPSNQFRPAFGKAAKPCSMFFKSEIGFFFLPVENKYRETAQFYFKNGCLSIVSIYKKTSQRI
jgi:hypothetical protein